MALLIRASRADDRRGTPDRGEHAKLPELLRCLSSHIAFNTSEGWARDVSEDVAREMLNRAAKEDRILAGASRRFVERHVDEDELLRAGVAD